VPEISRNCNNSFGIFLAHLEFSRQRTGVQSGVTIRKPERQVHKASHCGSSFFEGCTWHDLHILVAAPFCCDPKARATSAQSSSLWQQATIEITLLLLVRATYIRVLFFAHIPFVLNCTFNATLTERLQQWQKDLVNGRTL